MFDNKGKALSQITESGDAYEVYPSFNKDGSLVVYSKIQLAYYRKVNWATFFFGFGGSTIVVEKFPTEATMPATIRFGDSNMNK